MNNTTFKVSLNNGEFFKSINTPIIKKVLSYIVIDGKAVNSNEWNIEINSQEDLQEFVIDKMREYGFKITF